MQKPSPPMGVIFASLILVAASFMTWGTALSTPAQMPPGFAELGIPGQGPMELTATAWNSYLTVSGIEIPNWTSVLGVALLTAFAILRFSRIWSSPLIVDLLVSVALVVQIGSMLLAFGSNGRIGFGILLSMLCALVLLLLTVKTLWDDRAFRSAERRRLEYERSQPRTATVNRTS